jgi:hypothetical protein
VVWEVRASVAIDTTTEPQCGKDFWLVVSRHHDVQLLPATRSQKTEATSSVLFTLESIAPGRATGGATRRKKTA